MSTYNQNKNKTSSEKPESNFKIRLSLYSTYWSALDGGIAVNSPIVEYLQVSEAFLIKDSEEIKQVIKSVYISSN